MYLCVHTVVSPAVCCSSFAWPAPGCPVPDPAQEGYCWPGGASGWGKAETVMGGRHPTEHHPGPEQNKCLTEGQKHDSSHITNMNDDGFVICDPLFVASINS